MIQLAWQWAKINRVLLVNVLSLVGTTAVTASLGFVYWWVAARQFVPAEVGLSSAMISAMTLLGTICMLGLGTLLISELPKHKDAEFALINTALLIVALAGGFVGLLFALLAPVVAPNFQPLRSGPASVLIFAAGVGLTSVTLVFDQALLGLLRGELQLWRNSLFAVVKLAVLFMIGLWITQRTGISIYATWAIGNVLSMLILAIGLLPRLLRTGQSFWPRWGLLRKLRAGAFEHHMLNLTLQVPSLALPVLVTALLSTTANAWFYVSWMLAGLASLLPSVLATVLFAANARQPEALAQRARMTLGIATVVCVGMCLFLLLGTEYLLNIFGHNSAEQASWSLRILALGSLPRIIKDHYVAICRIKGQVRSAVGPMIVGSLLELILAALGAHLAGLLGLSLGWLFALCIEALFGANTVYKTVIINTSEKTTLSVRSLAD